MNSKALIVITWVALSGYVTFRDWSGDKEKCLQELTGIWLLSVAALVLGEMSDSLGLVAELILAADVLIQPGSTNAGQTAAKTISQILPSTKTQPATAGASSQGVLA